MIDFELFPVPVHIFKLFLLAGTALVLHQIAYRIFLPLFTRMSRKTKITWDDILIRRKAVARAFHLLPATVISVGVPLILDTSTELASLLSKVTNLYYIVVGFAVFEALLNTVQDIYEQQQTAKRISIRGFLQACKVLGFLFSLILIISQLAGKSPIYFLSGLGAFTAILLLVFKDSILGLVAGIQLSAMDLIRKGDWIEISKHGADGDVIDISLTTVRVQNWDKTITAIPAYELVSSSFKNWRGMSECGGRRIKRAINIDLNTISFLRPEDLEQLLKIKLLRDYLEEKLSEIQSDNTSHFSNTELSVLANGRRLTNVGTFRAYCIAYLRSHPKIHQNLTFLVRQLHPTPEGLPLEIYVFTNDVRWAAYESIQADIFDHLLAILPQFRLKAFQNISGEDLRTLTGRYPCGTPEHTVNGDLLL